LRRGDNRSGGIICFFSCRALTIFSQCRAHHLPVFFSQTHTKKKLWKYKFKIRKEQIFVMRAFVIISFWTGPKVGSRHKEVWLTKLGKKKLLEVKNKKMGTHILKYTNAHRCTQHYYTNFITTLLLKVSPDTRRFYAFRTKAVIVIHGAQNAQKAPKKKNPRKREKRDYSLWVKSCHHTFGYHICVLFDNQFGCALHLNINKGWPPFFTSSDISISTFCLIGMDTPVKCPRNIY